MTTSQVGERQTRTVEITHSRADEDGTYEITIAANNVARDNYDLDLGSLRVDNYLRNPVVLWAHDRRMPPIGRTRGIERIDGQLRARFEFLEGDPFAERIRNAWNQGFIGAASISWGGGDISFLGEGRIRESNAELYEWSLVPVPADADALRSAERALGLPEGILGREEATDLTNAHIDVLTRAIEGLTARIESLENREPPAPAEKQPSDEWDIGSLRQAMADFKSYLEADDA